MGFFDITCLIFKSFIYLFNIWFETWTVTEATQYQNVRRWRSNWIMHLGQKAKRKNYPLWHSVLPVSELLIKRNTKVVWGFVFSDFIVDIGYTRNTKSIDYNNMLHIFQFKWLFSSRRVIPWYEEKMEHALRRIYTK